MRCPTCGQHTPDDWKWYSLTARQRRLAAEKWGQGSIVGDDIGEDDIAQPGGKYTFPSVAVSFMRCGNSDCKELLIRVHERERVFDGAVPLTSDRTWLARPRTGVGRPIDPLIPENYRRDFSEAVDILDRSPRMSAVMSRRILADLLEQFDGRVDWHVRDRVRKFVADTKHPQEVRENAEHIVLTATFGAHTKKSDQDVIIDVERDEAEWLIDLIGDLFDYFIVRRARSAQLRQRIEEKTRAAGLPPATPPPEKKRK